MGTPSEQLLMTWIPGLLVQPLGKYMTIFCQVSRNVQSETQTLLHLVTTRKLKNPIPTSIPPDNNLLISRSLTTIAVTRQPATSLA